MYSSHTNPKLHISSEAIHQVFITTFIHACPKNLTAWLISIPKLGKQCFPECISSDLADSSLEHFLEQRWLSLETDSMCSRFGRHIMCGFWPATVDIVSNIYIREVFMRVRHVSIIAILRIRELSYMSKYIKTVVPTAISLVHHHTIDWLSCPWLCLSIVAPGCTEKAKKKKGVCGSDSPHNNALWQACHAVCKYWWHNTVVVYVAHLPCYTNLQFIIWCLPITISDHAAIHKCKILKLWGRCQVGACRAIVVILGVRKLGGIALLRSWFGGVVVGCPPLCMPFLEG